MQTRNIPLWLGAMTLLTIGAGLWAKDHLAGDVPPPPPPPAAQTATRTYDYTHNVNTPTARTIGRRWTVAILRFGDNREVENVPFGPASQPAPDGSNNVTVKVNVVENARTERQARPQMDKRSREMLKHALVSSKAFNVVERERILEILREVNFGKTQYVDPASAPPEQQIIAARYIIEGSLGFNEDRTLKDTLDREPTYKDGPEYPPGMSGNIFNPGNVNREMVQAAVRQMERKRAENRLRAQNYVSCYLSAYQVHTGQVVSTVTGIGRNELEAIDDAVESLIEDLSSLDSDIFVAAVSGDKVYLDVGEGGQIKPGQRFTIIHNGNPVRQRDGGVIGYEQTETGQIEVTDVGPDMSVTKVISKTAGIARGDLARPVKQ